MTGCNQGKTSAFASNSSARRIARRHVRGSYQSSMSAGVGFESGGAEVSIDGPLYRNGGYMCRQPRSSTGLFADIALTIAALKCAAPAACGCTAAITTLRARATNGHVS